MQRIISAILAISMAAVIVTITAASGMLPTAFMIAQSTPTPNFSDSGKVIGHVTYVVRGPDGNIISYVQTDNTRTVQGIQCTEFILFNLNNGAKQTANSTSDSCQGLSVRSSSGWNGFNVIGLVNGSGTMSLNGSDTATTTKFGGTRASSADGLILTATANEGAPQQATTITPGSTAGTYNQITLTSPTFAFSNLKSTGTTIRGSFLMNNTSTTSTLDNVFAENQLSPTVTVGSGDTLTVTWTITLT